MKPKKNPIGYYLKLADNCLTKRINEIQSQFGLNRTEWQIIHSIYEKPAIPKNEIFDLIVPISDNKIVEDILSGFMNRHLVENKNDMLSLTSEGMDLHKSCFETQKEFRKKAVTDISEKDYDTTITTLKKLVANLS